MDTTQKAEQEQSGGKGFLQIAALIAAAFLIFRKPAVDGNGGGDNGGGAGGPVTVNGRVSAVSVGQGAVMGTHLVEKVFGEGIKVETTFTVSAVDANGVGVPWNYRLVTKLGHNTLAGWKTSGELGFADASRTFREDGLSTFNLNQALPNLFTAITIFIAPEDPNQEWDIRVELQAERSSTTGAPVTGDWVELATGQHPGAVLTVSGTTNLFGTVRAVNVSQPRRRRPLMRARR